MAFCLQNPELTQSLWPDSSWGPKISVLHDESFFRTKHTALGQGPHGQQAPGGQETSAFDFLQF